MKKQIKSRRKITLSEMSLWSLSTHSNVHQPTQNHIEICCEKFQNFWIITIMFSNLIVKYVRQIKFSFQLVFMINCFFKSFFVSVFCVWSRPWRNRANKFLNPSIWNTYWVIKQFDTIILRSFAYILCRLSTWDNKVFPTHFSWRCFWSISLRSADIFRRHK